MFNRETIEELKDEKIRDEVSEVEESEEFKNAEAIAKGKLSKNALEQLITEEEFNQMKVDELESQGQKWGEEKE